MADPTFMFATMAGVIAALAALLLVLRGHRRSRPTTAISNNEPSSPSSSFSEGNFQYHPQNTKNLSTNVTDINSKIHPSYSVFIS